MHGVSKNKNESKNNAMPKKITQDQFLQVPFYLLKSTSIGHVDIMIISYVIGWKKNKKKCFIGNGGLAQLFGMQRDAIEARITKLNKYPFFNSEADPHYNDFGSWVNSKEMDVDVDKLKQYLADEPKLVDAKNKKVRVAVQSSQPAVKPDVQLEPKQKAKAACVEMTQQAAPTPVKQPNEAPASIVTLVNKQTSYSFFHSIDGEVLRYIGEQNLQLHGGTYYQRMKTHIDVREDITAEDKVQMEKFLHQYVTTDFAMRMENLTRPEPSTFGMTINL